MKGCTTLRCKINKRYECRKYKYTTRCAPIGSDVCLDCEIFIKAKQSIFIDNGGGVLMSLDKELAKKAKEAPKFMAMADVPDKIKLLLTSYKFKADARGSEALFLYLKTKDNRTIVQKYTESSYEEIQTAIKKAGGGEHLKDTLTTWQKQIVGRMQLPRLVPVKEQ